MKCLRLAAINIAVICASSLPAFAQAAQSAGDADSIPSSVWWAAGVVGFIAFLLGTIPPNRGEMAADEIDIRGGGVWAIAAACIAGSAAYMLAMSQWSVVGLVLISVGALIVVVRLVATRPARIPLGPDLEPGINHAPGTTVKQRFKAAQRLYDNATFHDERHYPATRSRLEFRFGALGMPVEDLQRLGRNLPEASRYNFDILVLLVRELPGEAEQPGVIVVRGADQLKLVQTTNDGIIIPAMPKVAASSIVASVGYAWR